MGGAETKGTWTSIENGAVHVYMPNAAAGAKKVAAFDIDGALQTFFAFITKPYQAL